MERTARLLSKLRTSQPLLDVDGMVRSVWPAAVGKAIAKHTIRLKVVRNRLVVGVEDAIWQKQLFALSSQIVDRVQKCMASTAIQEVEFRIVPARRVPQREEALPSTQQAVADEAEGIEDPVLKRIYRLSRKKSTA